MATLRFQVCLRAIWPIFRIVMITGAGSVRISEILDVDNPDLVMRARHMLQMFILARYSGREASWRTLMSFTDSKLALSGAAALKEEFLLRTLALRRHASRRCDTSCCDFVVADGNTKLRGWSCNAAIDSTQIFANCKPALRGCAIPPKSHSTYYPDHQHLAQALPQDFCGEGGAGNCPVSKESRSPLRTGAGEHSRALWWGAVCVWSLCGLCRAFEQQPFCERFATVAALLNRAAATFAQARTYLKRRRI